MISTLAHPLKLFTHRCARKQDPRIYKHFGSIFTKSSRHLKLFSMWLYSSGFLRAYFVKDLSRAMAVSVRQTPEGHMVSIDFLSRLALFSDSWSELV